jgi:hypothetical protein
MGSKCRKNKNKLELKFANLMQVSPVTLFNKNINKYRTTKIKTNNSNLYAKQQD